MAVRLVGATRSAVAGDRSGRRTVRRRRGAHVGRGNALVGVGSLLDDDLLVGRLAGAAADADEPEEARGNGKGDGEPDDGHHLLAEVGVDVVGFEHGVEDTDEGSVDTGRGTGCGNTENGLSLMGVLVGRSTVRVAVHLPCLRWWSPGCPIG